MDNLENHMVLSDPSEYYDPPDTRHCDFCGLDVDELKFNEELFDDAAICDDCLAAARTALTKYLTGCATEMTQQQREIAKAWIDALESERI